MTQRIGSMSMAVMQKTNRIFTDMDRKAHARLAEIWKLKAASLGLTQEKAALELGMTQGAVSQYLKGKIPLRIVASLKFAKLLRVKPTQIREDLTELTSELPAEALDFAQRFANLTPEQQRRFEAILLLSASSVPDSKLKDWHAPAENDEPPKTKRRNTRQT